MGPLTTDQRGFDRPFDIVGNGNEGTNTVDIGAFESIPVDYSVSPAGVVTIDNTVSQLPAVVLTFIGGDLAVSGAPITGIAATSITGIEVFGADNLDERIDLGSITAGSLPSLAANGILLQGGSGNDKILGSAYDDILEGGAGDDYLYGNEGEDTLLGEAGIDFLFGGADDDSLDGGLNHGSVEFGEIGDVLFGDSGQDQYFVNTGSLSTLFVEGPGDDRYIFGSGEVGAAYMVRSESEAAGSLSEGAASLLSGGTDTLDFSALSFRALVNDVGAYSPDDPNFLLYYFNTPETNT